jgi:hypothetical protein
MKQTGGVLPLFSSVRNRVRQSLWDLSITTVEPQTAPVEMTGFDDKGEGKEVIENQIQGHQSGVTELSHDAFFHGSGTVGMAGATSFGSRWEAPESGTYTLTAAYWGYGAYDPGVGNPGELDVDTTGTAETNLAVTRSPEMVVEDATKTNIGAANQTASEETAEALVGFLAKHIIRYYFGFIGAVIATFLMHAFEPELSLPRGSKFNIDPYDEQELSVTFSARRGETYDIYFTPCVGFSHQSREPPHQPFVPSLYAKYSLQSLKIEEGGDTETWGDTIG